MKKGFTLIEFLVVIAIIGILSAVVLASLNSAQNKGEIGEAVSTSIFPEPSNYVVDAAGALKPETVDALNADLKAFDGTAQIAVAVVKTTAPLDINGYSIQLADYWKAGHEGVDNGVIIVLATEDRKVRIEVGKGLEGQIPDAVAGRIIDDAMIPYLKNSDWDGAIVAGVSALKEKITK